MQFKIDAKEQYTVIKPQSTLLDNTLAANLAEKCQELTQIAAQNFIIDLSDCQDVQKDCLDPLLALAIAQSEQSQSFVLSNVPSAFISLIKAEEAIDSINYAPSLIEAVDIINMEILERDLLNEE
jgi:hypothetical protein